MKKLRRVFLLVILLLITLPIVGNSSIYAADAVTPADIASDGSLPADCYYFNSKTTYVYKDTNGDCGTEIKITKLEKLVKDYYYAQFLVMGSDVNRFTSKTDILKGIDYSFTNTSPLKNQKVTSFCQGAKATSGYFIIPIANKKYKFFIPCSTYESSTGVYDKKTKSSAVTTQKQGLISEYSNTGVKISIVALKEGIIAGNIQKGFNVGSVYSTNQKPLNDVMTATSAGASTTNDNAATATTTPSKTTTALTNTSGSFFKFKTSASMKATMDYFINPLFGRISIEDLPTTDDEWNVKIKELDALISGDSIKIAEAYLDFIDGTSPDLEGIKDSGDLDFTNGVKAYKDGLTTDEPLQKVNYNMRIAVPSFFVQKSGSTYKLKSDGLYIIPDIRMSVYNDTIYKTDSETGVVTKLCTNADIQLDRSYLAFFNQEQNGQPVGVVVVLRYDEAVVDTTNDGKMYITGRKITFGGNYSSTLNLNNTNKDALYFSTSASGKVGISPKNFAFNSDLGGATSDRQSVYTDKVNHTELDDESGFVMYVDFRTIDAAPKEETAEEETATQEASEDVENIDSTYNCFVIVRNNMYINDGQLLNWLASEEGKATTNVEAEVLRQKIRGEFDESLENLSYTDWRAMQAIKAELGQEKDGFLIHLIRTTSIIFGSLLIILAITFVLAYWFDIFNNFIDFSILYFISGKNMYPVADKESIRYVSEYEGKTKFVVFTQVLVISAVCCLLGLVFLNASSLLDFFFSLYTYFMTTLGGQ